VPKTLGRSIRPPARPAYPPLHIDPTVRNPRHERFAQELATGKTADAAAKIRSGAKLNEFARSRPARDPADRFTGLVRIRSYC
jgi:hypothetical protein